MSKLIETEVGWVYLIAPITNPNYCKIGRVNPTKDSVKSLTNRIKGIQTSNPVKLVFYGLIHGGLDVEQYLHYIFRDVNLTGEWFKFSSYIFGGEKECNIGLIFVYNGWFKLFKQDVVLSRLYIKDRKQPQSLRELIKPRKSGDWVDFVNDENSLKLALIGE